MIGVIVIYSILFVVVLCIGIYNLHVRKENRHIAEENLEKAVREAFDNGYKKGFADGEQQGYRDGKMFSQIAAHNESVLRKQGVIK